MNRMTCPPVTALGALLAALVALAAPGAIEAQDGDDAVRECRCEVRLPEISGELRHEIRELQGRVLAMPEVRDELRGVRAQVLANPEIRGELRLARERLRDAADTLRAARIRIAHADTLWPEQFLNMFGDTTWTHALPELGGLAISREGPYALFRTGPQARFGVRLYDLGPELGRYFGREEGALVLEVEEDAALDLEAGDVLAAIDGRSVASADHAARILRSYEPGEEMELEVWREGSRITIRAVAP